MKLGRKSNKRISKKLYVMDMKLWNGNFGEKKIPDKVELVEDNSMEEISSWKRLN